MKLKFIRLLLVPATLMFLLAGCNSSSSTDYFQKGHDYLDQGDYHQAIQEYDEAIRLDPDDADAYYSRGLAYGKLGQYERAIQDYDEAIRLDPDDANAYFNRAYAFDELGEYERAIDDLDQAIRLDPQDGTAYNNRGVAYQSLGKDELAERDWQKAKQLGYTSQAAPTATAFPTMSPQDIKAQAENIEYDPLYRYIETHVGKIIHLKGTAVQIIIGEDDRYGLRLAMDGDLDHVIYINYRGDRVLEGDTVEVWGRVKGLLFYEALFGNTVTTPEINSLIAIVTPP